MVCAKFFTPMTSLERPYFMSLEGAIVCEKRASHMVLVTTD
eukprot:SAG25_NODE_63_length_17756_cov_10.156765_2_plen_41_part_00